LKRPAASNWRPCDKPHLERVICAAYLEVERLEENVQHDPPRLIGDLATLLRLKVEDVHQGLHRPGRQMGIATSGKSQP
jgi:hypothetical protein